MGGGSMVDDLHILEFYEFQLCAIIPSTTLLASIIPLKTISISFWIVRLAWLCWTYKAKCYTCRNIPARWNWAVPWFLSLSREGQLPCQNCNRYQEIAKRLSETKTHSHFPTPKQFVWKLLSPHKYTQRKIKQHKKKAVRSHQSKFAIIWSEENWHCLWRRVFLCIFRR